MIMDNKKFKLALAITVLAIPLTFTGCSGCGGCGGNKDIEDIASGIESIEKSEVNETIEEDLANEGIVVETPTPTPEVTPTPTPEADIPTPDTSQPSEAPDTPSEGTETPTEGTEAPFDTQSETPSETTDIEIDEEFMEEIGKTIEDILDAGIPSISDLIPTDIPQGDASDVDWSQAGQGHMGDGSSWTGGTMTMD